MQDHPPSTSLTPASTATLFVALDLSRSSWVAAVHAPHADKISRHKLTPGAGGFHLTNAGASSPPLQW